MILTNDGLSLYAEKIGGGAPIMIPQRLYLREYFQTVVDNRTAVFYDPRNRGLSETVSDEGKLARGVLHDVDDMEAIRRHYGFEKMAILAHSYIGVVALLYAAANPERISRIVLIGPVAPDPSKIYAPELRSSDGGLEAFQRSFADLQRRTTAMNPMEQCLAAWDLLRVLYVAHPSSAKDLHWAPCNIPNEANFMLPFMKYVMPSLTAIRWSEETLSRITAPTLIIHGRKDRSSPYGAGRDWTQCLPNARLVTIEDAAHVPWIEAPKAVYAAIQTFLDGSWPDTAEQLAL
jgi:proline iminopeptidase